MKQNAESAPAIDRAFINIASAHKGGAIITDVSAALKQVTAAVQQTGKSGKVTLTMSLRPAGAASVGTLVFEAKVKATAPETPSPASIFYADGDFNLVREDPSQTKLDLREVTEEPKQPVESLRKAGAE